MMITILYSLWIAYTVGSLSLIGLVVVLSLIAKWENKKNRERINKLLEVKEKENYNDEGW